MPAKTQITLDYPITVAGAQVSVLHIRRATVADLKAARAAAKGKDDFELGVILAANLAEVSPADIECLDLADFKKVEGVVDGFLEPSKR